MPGTWDPDSAALEADERLVTTHDAVAAIVAGKAPPLATTFQREVAEVAEGVLGERVRRARMARLKARVGD